jgi:hypothetical protein
MSRPLLEVADIFRTWVGRFLDRSRARISWPQLKVIRAIERCRTAALGIHRERCSDCGKDFGYSFNSCRNRHCPKCQTQARNRWVEARTRELVPLNYFHVVFTVPHQLSELMLQNKRLLYNLLFRDVAVFAAFALTDTDDHALLVDVLGPEVTQLGAADARRVKCHQNRLVPKVRGGFDEPGDFAPAEHSRWLMTHNLRQRGIVGEQRLSQHLAVEETECGRLQPDASGVQFPVNEMKLVLPNLLRPQLIGRAVEICGEPSDGADIGACGSLRVISTFEFLERPDSKFGHRDLLVTKHYRL